MGSTWRKARTALGLNLCVTAPRTSDDDGDENSRRFSDAATTATATASSLASLGSDYRALPPIAPNPTAPGLRISKSGSRSSKKICGICLGTMKAGQGHALFTAECSHIFHFHCIASNVMHGNRECPNCRDKWKEIPIQGPLTSELPHGRTRVHPIGWPHQDDTLMSVVRRVPRANSIQRQQQHLNLFNASEPTTYYDDEPIEESVDCPIGEQEGRPNILDIKTYPEFSAIPKSASEDNFTVLVHLKAPQADTRTTLSGNLHSHDATRAPVDLVTVLDISGSMSGTNLALLKQAMGFVIQNLGPSDRLSVIAFSSSARRLFHLRKMSETGRQQALQAVNALIASGGTNIAEGLRKGAKVIEERKQKNPVCSIILLSDGQDTYTMPSTNGADTSPNYRSLLPSSIQMPVHAFGFGADHDSALMHSISENSSGTFSFIEDQGFIQDAFAQCIGGLLSVMVQELQLKIECIHPGVRLAPIKSGSYASVVLENGRRGSIAVGDLYADEERDFLVSVNVPVVSTNDIMLLKFVCAYKDPISNVPISLEGGELRIERPDVIKSRSVSIEVDRERNRVRAAEAMEEARAAAEQGLLPEAVSILETQRRIIAESLAGRNGDRLCIALDAELMEMKERMASRQRYEDSGRAYMLSGLSSHLWQRATARGDSIDSAYQTPSMVDMVTRSQILSPSFFRAGTSTPPLPPLRPNKSFSSPLARPG